jgi:hypothetical protein
MDEAVACLTGARECLRVADFHGAALDPGAVALQVLDLGCGTVCVGCVDVGLYL